MTMAWISYISKRNLYQYKTRYVDVQMNIDLKEIKNVSIIRLHRA